MFLLLIKSLHFEVGKTSELSQSTSLSHGLADHLDKEDVSFDHIHGDYITAPHN